MGTFLQIIGIVFLAILVILTLGGLYIWRKWRSIKELMEDSPSMYSKIHLNEDINPLWTEKPETSAIAKDFESIGFSKGRAYLIKEMPGTRLMTFFKTDEGIAAYVCENDKVGLWTDVCLKYEDDSEITLSNASYAGAGAIDSKPNAEKIIREGAGVIELYGELKKRLDPDKPIFMVNDGNFREFFEEEYRKDVEWRAKRGGISEAEMRRMAEAEGLDMSDEDLQEAMLGMKRMELDQWHDECVDQFAEDKKIPGGKIDRDYHRLFIVSDQIDVRLFIEYVADFLDLSENQVESFHGLADEIGNASAMFERINNSLSTGLRAENLGTVDFPIRADIWRIPELEDL